MRGGDLELLEALARSLPGGLGYWVLSLGFRVWGFGFWVWGVGFRVEGLGFRV